MQTRAHTIEQLAIQSFALLRKHPSLAMPVVAADLLSFAAMHIQHALHQPLFALVLGNRVSVLDTARGAFVPTPENVVKAALLTAPLIWGCYFISVCLYTAALLITFAFIQQIECDSAPDWGFAVNRTLRSKKRLFVFSISMVGALAIAAVLLGIASAGSTRVPWLTEKVDHDFDYAFALAIEVVIALLFTRPALGLLRGSQVPGAGIERTAILWAVITVAAQMGFLLFLDHAAPSFLFQQRTVVGYLIGEATISLIGASPYIVLFIGLSLLAATDRSIVDERGPEQIV